MQSRLSRSARKKTYPVAKSSDRPIRVHQSVKLVDSLHVAHGAERRVTLNVILVVKPRGHLLVQRPSLVFRALGTAVKVLARVFGHPEVTAAHAVVVAFDIGLEALGRDVVPVDRDEAVC